VNSFSITESKAITEAGVLNEDAAGIMLGAQTFSAVNVVSGDTLEISYKIDID